MSDPSLSWDSAAAGVGTDNSVVKSGCWRNILKRKRVAGTADVTSSESCQEVVEATMAHTAGMGEQDHISPAIIAQELLD